MPKRLLLLLFLCAGSLGLPAFLCSDAADDAVNQANDAMRQGQAQMQKNDEELAAHGIEMIKVDKTIARPSGGDPFILHDYPAGFRCRLCRREFHCDGDDQNSIMQASQGISAHMCEAGHGPYVLKCNGEPCDRPEFHFELANDAKSKCESFRTRLANELEQKVSFKGGEFQGKRMGAEEAARQFLSECICENSGASSSGGGNGGGNGQSGFGGDGSIGGLSNSLVGMVNNNTQKDVANAKAGVDAQNKGINDSFKSFHDNMNKDTAFKDRPMAPGFGDKKGPERPSASKDKDKLSPAMKSAMDKINNLPAE